MNVLFLAGVGNHDLLVRDRSRLPAKYQEEKLPSRTLGEVILSDPQAYADTVEFPLIGVCLRWLLEDEGVSPDTLHVHLFATDQEEPPTTPETEWAKDTISVAKVIQHALVEGWLEWEDRTKGGGRNRRPLRLPKRQVQIHRIPSNPADYQDMLRYFSEELSKLREKAEAAERVYMEVTGGTPAMTSMMLVAGVEVFGRRVHTLYVVRGADRPYRVGIGERLLRRRAITELREQIRLHAYSVARERLQEDGEWLIPDGERRECVAALLEYAARRLSFDFERAREALQRAQRYAQPEVRAHIFAWDRALRSQERADLLAELVHSMRIKYEMGEYADLTGRLFRFQEAALRCLAEQVGLRYKDKEGKYVDPDWVREVPGLESFLQEYPLENGKRGVQWEDRDLNRVILSAIVEFFAEDNPELRSVVGEKGLKRISSLAQLRNKGLAGHGFQGIGKEDLAEAFGEDPDRIIPFVKDLYARIFGREVPPDPYEAVNEQLRGMLAA